MRMSPRRLLTALAFLGAAASASGAPAQEPKDYDRVQPLLNATESVVGERLAYPSGPPVVTSLIVTMTPGESTGWHKHGVPSYAYILAGQVTVEYEGSGRRTYKHGDAFMEAMDRWHTGVNDGAEPCRILVVFMGAAGSRPVVRRE
jgi:quercetin dioxygenase-like cupin family protein